MGNKFEGGNLIPGEQMDAEIFRTHEQGTERKLTDEELGLLHTMLEKEWENALVAQILEDVDIDSSVLKPGDIFTLSEKDIYKLALALSIIKK